MTTPIDEEAEIRRLERETEGLKILKEQQDAENKRLMDELDTVSTGVPDRDESEPLEEVDDAKVRALLDDPEFTAQFRDLGEELQAGRISREQFTEAVVNRLTFMERGGPPPPPAEDAHDAHVEGTDECLAIIVKYSVEGLGTALNSEETFASLNAILSGPPSSPEQRARWPRGITLDNADPVCTAKVIDEGWGEHRDTFVLAFESEEAARVWVWKMNYEVFYGEGASMHLCHNMNFGTFRLPENLQHLIQYYTDGSLECDGAGGLKLKDGKDRVGRFEVNAIRHGAGPDGREPLSEWVARTCRRLSGEVSYETTPREEIERLRAPHARFEAINATADATAQLREEIAGLTVDEPSDDDSDVDEAAMAAMEQDLLDRMPPEGWEALAQARREGRGVSIDEFLDLAGLPPAPRDDAEPSPAPAPVRDDAAAMAAMERDLFDRMPPESFAALQAAWDEGREVSMEEFFAGLPPAPPNGDAE